MSDISKLFRATKLKELRLAPASIMDDPVLQKSKFSMPLTQGNKHPIHQEVETYEHLREKYEEFGIKAKLPSKSAVKSNIIIGDIVTRYKATHYERDTQSSLNKTKFNYYNFPVKYADNEGIKKSPLLEGVELVSYNLAEISEKFPYIIEALKTPEYKKKFKQFCAENYPEKMKYKNFSANNFKTELEAFINKNMISDIDQIPEDIRGFGGLTYSLPGRLSTDPNGIKHTYVVPSRLTLQNNSMALGFVSQNIIKNYNPQMKYLSRNVLQLTPAIFEGFETSNDLDTAKFTTSNANLYRHAKYVPKPKPKPVAPVNEAVTAEAAEEEKPITTVKSRILDAIKR